MYQLKYLGVNQTEPSTVYVCVSRVTTLKIKSSDRYITGPLESVASEFMVVKNSGKNEIFDFQLTFLVCRKYVSVQSMALGICVQSMSHHNYCIPLVGLGNTH